MNCQELIFFTKLNFRFGFHLIRMSPDDIPKTYFGAYVVHFEYLLTPFRLHNYFATFQSLVNYVFQKLLGLAEQPTVVHLCPTPTLL